MATNKTRKQLKQEALENLAASREEIGREIQRLRVELNPKRIIREAVGRHKGAVVGTTAILGVTASLLILRHMRSRGIKRPEIRRGAEKVVEDSGFGSQALKVLVGTLVPVLVKSAVVNPLLESLTRQKSVPKGGQEDGTR